ncbi:MAG: spermidine synthase [Syntrophaceae bacterium]
MKYPWRIIQSISTPEGLLELRQRGEGDFLITLGPTVLMNSLAHRSEAALGQLAGEHVRRLTRPRVLVGGLGMGFTLRAVLDALPAAGQVVVAEINPAVLDWCRGPLEDLTQCAVADPRVAVHIADVAELIRVAAQGKAGRYDAIVLDLYTGPHAATDELNDPLYGQRAIERMRAALATGGVLTVWGENYDASFDKRLSRAGFTVSTRRPGRGGLRHIVYVAQLSGTQANRKRGGH